VPAIGITDVATIGVLGLVGTNLIVSTRRSWRDDARAHTRRIVVGLRPLHFLGAPPVLALVLGAAVVLLQFPPLRFGWWTAIGGLGNPVVGASSTMRGSPLAWIVPAVFVILLVPLLPQFAEREELSFRAGAEIQPWPRRLRRCLAFGLVHALVGIPIGAAIALSLGGLYFMLVYLHVAARDGRDAAVLASTRAHVAYNVVALTLAAIFIFATA
jgi:hypothetical protein